LKFTQTDFTGTKEILKFTDHYVAIAVTVSDANVVANADGKKIVEKGTIVGGIGGKVLADDSLSVEKKNTQGALTGEAGAAVDAEGVLLNDVDVTHGPASGAMIIHGFINTNKVPEAPVADAVDALKMIQFID